MKKAYIKVDVCTESKEIVIFNLERQFVRKKLRPSCWMKITIKLGCLHPASLFHPSIILEVRPIEWHTRKCISQEFFTNIKLVWKKLSDAKTLSYFSRALGTMEKAYDIDRILSVSTESKEIVSFNLERQFVEKKLRLSGWTKWQMSVFCWPWQAFSAWYNTCVHHEMLHLGKLWPHSY